MIEALMQMQIMTNERVEKDRIEARKAAKCERCRVNRRERRERKASQTRMKGEKTCFLGLLDLELQHSAAIKISIRGSCCRLCETTAQAKRPNRVATAVASMKVTRMKVKVKRNHTLDLTQALDSTRVVLCKQQLLVWK